MKNKYKNEYWISKVELGGYKSLQNVSTTFTQGLNVIIGKNSTGKTNFLDFLYNSINMEFREVRTFHANFDFHYQDKFVQVKVSGEEVKQPASYSFAKSNEAKTRLRGRVCINGEMVKEASRTLRYDSEDVFLGEITEYLSFTNQIRYDNIILIRYGLPKKIEGLSIFESVAFNQETTTYDGSVYDAFITFANKYKWQITTLNEKIDELYIELEKEGLLLEPTLLKYTKIEAVRWYNGITITKQNEKLCFSNLLLEFKVNGNWFFFEDLSDGLKRIIFIMDKVIELDNAPVFLEEPELGIHPHQLDMLMKFLKEQSYEKQIIITTHSPQVLDVLEPDELDHIIVVDADKKGTFMYHLDEKKQQKARAYMENEDTLSSYWRFSDLEPRTLGK